MSGSVVKAIRTKKPVTKEVICYTFKCESCGFEADTERAVVEHCTNIHSYTEKKQIEGDDFFKFESLAGIRLYFEYVSFYGFGKVQWKGPGWYGVEKYEAVVNEESSTPIEHVDIIPLAEYLPKRESDIANYEEKIVSIRRMLAELKELK